MSFIRIVFVSILFLFVGNMGMRRLFASVTDRCIPSETQGSYSQLQESPPVEDHSDCDTNSFFNLLSIHSPFQSLQLCGRMNLTTIPVCYLTGKIILSFSMRDSSLSEIFLKSNFPEIKLSCFPPCEYFVYALRKIII